MADYKETSMNGNAWQRCKSVTIGNPLSGEKFAFFAEERVINLPDGLIFRPLEGCGKKFLADGVFPLLDPTTNLPTGASMTHTDLYVALYSLYMQTAMERDSNV
jgi:hypothetical protein